MSTAVVTVDEDAAVQVGYVNDQVFMLLDPAHAEVLARCLAQLDALLDPEDLDFFFHRDTWRRTMIDLLTAKAHTGGHPAPVYVPVGVPC